MAIQETSSTPHRSDGAQQRESTLVAEWPKNKREKFRVSLDKYYGTDCITIRVWYILDDGSERPSRCGLSTAVRHLPKIMEAFAKAIVDARNLGLIEGDGVADE